jgi:hypothetical protein
MDLCLSNSNEYHIHANCTILYMHTYDPPLLCVTHVYLGSGVQLQMNTICMQSALLCSCIHMIHLSWVCIMFIWAQASNLVTVSLPQSCSKANYLMLQLLAYNISVRQNITNLFSRLLTFQNLYDIRQTSNTSCAP